MHSLLIAPSNLFTLIQLAIKEKPESLSAFNWHELSGREAYGEDEIMRRATKHCLAGWIVAMTPNAPKFEGLREDVDVYANEILVSSGRKPIPIAIYHSDEESMRKIIAMRAAKEQEDKDFIKKLFN